MPVQRLQEQYPALSEFLMEHFHQDAYFEHEFATTMNELIDSVYDSLFVNEREVEPVHVKKIKEDMNHFLTSLVYENYKVRYIEDLVLMDTGELQPLEFVSYLYYRLKVELYERKLILEGGDEE